MKRALLIVALVAAPTSASTITRPPPKDSRCEIVEHGVYIPVTNPVRHEDASSATGTWTQVDVIRFTERTRVIEAKLERSFGYRYRVKNLPANVRVTWRIRYPRPVQNSAVWERSFETGTQNGELVSHLGYSFDYDWEMVTGNWVVEVLVDGQRTCSLRFAVK